MGTTTGRMPCVIRPLQQRPGGLADRQNRQSPGQDAAKLRMARSLPCPGYKLVRVLTGPVPLPPPAPRVVCVLSPPPPPTVVSDKPPHYRRHYFPAVILQLPSARLCLLALIPLSISIVPVIRCSPAIRSSSAPSSAFGACARAVLFSSSSRASRSLLLVRHRGTRLNLVASDRSLPWPTRQFLGLSPGFVRPNPPLEEMFRRC
ncbi:hypothetical protein T310_2038 [Rasamsonia emersonii CBS 393.64]|uniref:Uncharacterized protein n=1 Tax=Rasamsonia emersonii (strain ATCC 16479 / CBS 393.64 / IMI 116815) TaxID=1408163 RepID=A0A0F4Z1G8_RASE3|nr:hypothetical protein T310_2038 [Rasamsonia emersonii CBS 393.64]KKA23946.1 hypothetical protein T310_2038 [Rasamsonia emersonii CBS 393.64]